MLQAIRDRAMGVLGWVVIGLIIITFALFGLGSYLQDESNSYTARVNGVDISSRELQVAYQNQRLQMERLLGDRYDPALVDDSLLKQKALEGLISRQLILQEAAESGMVVSDQLLAARIHAIPAFQVDGKFDDSAYKRLLAQRGQPPMIFEYDTRQRLLGEQLVNGLSETTFVTSEEVNRAYRLQGQTRSFEYMIVSAAGLGDALDIDDAAIEAYYEKHADMFKTPERVRLSYLRLDAGSIGESIEVDEEALAEFYEEKKATLKGQEQRRASHILFQLDADADEATQEAVRARAETVLKQLEDGGDFAALAKEFSEDPGSSENAGDLGFFGKGAMVPAFEEAVFSMSEGETSQLVHSQFGYHIIRLTEIRASEIPTLDEVREELVAELRQQKVDDLYYEQLEQLTDLTYEVPDSLDEAAEALGLDIQTSDWITASGGEGIGKYPKVLVAAFSEDVLEAGNNSEVLEVGPNDAIVLRIQEREAAHPTPLPEVRERIVELIRKESAADKAREKGEALLSSVKDGVAMEDLEQGDGQQYHRAEAVGRAAAGHSPEVLSRVFKLARPADHSVLNTGFALLNGDYAIVQLSAVQDADPADMTEAERTQLLRGFENMRKNLALSLLVDDLRKRATIDIPEDRDE